MKILVIGSCRNNDYECKVRHDRGIVQEIGQRLAEKNHSIITGGAGGLQGILVDIYKQCNGPLWTAYYAEGEELNPNARPPSNRMPDDPILTHMSYPIRNAHYTGLCDGVVALSGRALTFCEIVNAAAGHGKRVFQMNIGNNPAMIRRFPELEKVLISSNIKTGLEYVEGIEEKRRIE